MKLQLPIYQDVDKDRNSVASVEVSWTEADISKYKAFQLSGINCSNSYESLVLFCPSLSSAIYSLVICIFSIPKSITRWQGSTLSRHIFLHLERPTPASSDLKTLSAIRRPASASSNFQTHNEHADPRIRCRSSGEDFRPRSGPVSGVYDSNRRNDGQLRLPDHLLESRATKGDHRNACYRKSLVDHPNESQLTYRRPVSPLSTA